VLFLQLADSSQGPKPCWINNVQLPQARSRENSTRAA